MIKKILLLFACIPLFLGAQDERLAASYFEAKDYEKAAEEYELLYKRSPQRLFYSQLYKCYSIAGDNKKLIQLVEKHIRKVREPLGFYYVDLGFAHAKNKDTKNAEKNYDKALSEVQNQAVQAFATANNFSAKGLFEYALKCYEIAEKADKNQNFAYQKALVYADLGQLQKMYETYIEILEFNPRMAASVKNLILRSFNSEGKMEDADYFLDLLTQKTLATQNPVMFDVLIFTYLQQKEYEEAFSVIKNWHNKTRGGLDEAFNLGNSLQMTENYTLAKDVFQWVFNNSQMPYQRITAEVNILKSESQLLLIKADSSTQLVYDVIAKIDYFLENQPSGKNYVVLMEAKAKLYSISLKDHEKAVEILDKVFATQAIAPLEKAQLLLTRGDFELLNQDFYESLLTYAQAEKLAEGNELADFAKLRAAKAAYFMGDIEWALSQFEVLHQSTSKKTSNDALDYAFVILSNSGEDTTYEAMTAYAKAEFLYYAGDYNMAYFAAKQVIQDYPSHPILDESHLLVAQSLEKQQRYAEAAEAYSTVYTRYGYDIYADIALFKAAVIYEDNLNNQAKADELYEKIIIDFTQSLYAAEARKRLRKLIN